MQVDFNKGERFVVMVDLEFTVKAFRIVAESHRDAQERIKRQYCLDTYQILNSKSTMTNEVCNNVIDDVNELEYID